MALKESKAQARDDSFKEKYERLQELLKKMNQKLADKEISLDNYKRLFKRFAESLPEAWIYTLYAKETDKFWRDGGSFDEEEFLSPEKCNGISELQGCLSIEKESVVGDDADEDQRAERRTKRKHLCKKCFWYGVLLGVLDSGAALEADSALAAIFC